MLQKQHKVDDSHYDMPLIYYTEGHSLYFGRPEFALITGLPFGHVNFGLYTSRELKFRNRVFPHKQGLSVTNLDVIGVIEDEETFQKLCDEDSIRLCLILCLEVIFIEKHSDEHYFGMKKDRMYVPTYTLSGFVFAFLVWIFESFERCSCWWIKNPNVIPRAIGWSKKSIFNRSDCGYLFAKESTTTSDIKPTKAEYESSWWIRSQLFFRQHVPKAPVVQHHSMYETYLAKLEKSRKRSHSSFRTSSGVLTTIISRPKKWIKDEVISQLNLCVFKLETIIQVFTRERKNEYGFKDEFSRLGREFMNSLNILFEELSQSLYTDENISNDYLVEEELRLCLEAEERMCLEHKKNIIEEQRFRVNEAKRMKLEEEKLLEISELKKKASRVYEFKSYEKYIRKDLSRSFHSLDTVWLTPDIQRFISREGNIKYPTRKGWLSEEHIDLWVDYMWHGIPDNAIWAMVSCYFVQILLQNSTPLFYDNGDKYATPWSDVDQVFFPINETAQHWCLAHFDILSGFVTFYDSVDTYDYESRDLCLAVNMTDLARGWSFED
ncbi:phospholipase-like protein [Tanacetum coccineum]|uniref:Phospholipase-like protein n=1 Tax=Tanacetum coccineum TaxID=301880 RepID=A0ABQ5ALP5_9ASTR